jgi:hypothetical protein
MSGKSGLSTKILCLKYYREVSVADDGKDIYQTEGKTLPKWLPDCALIDKKDINPEEYLKGTAYNVEKEKGRLKTVLKLGEPLVRYVNVKETSTGDDFTAPLLYVGDGATPLSDLEPINHPQLEQDLQHWRDCENGYAEAVKKNTSEIERLKKLLDSKKDILFKAGVYTGSSSYYEGDGSSSVWTWYDDDGNVYSNYKNGEYVGFPPRWEGDDNPAVGKTDKGDNYWSYTLYEHGKVSEGIDSKFYDYFSLGGSMPIEGQTVNIGFRPAWVYIVPLPEKLWNNSYESSESPMLLFDTVKEWAYDYSTHITNNGFTLYGTEWGDPYGTSGRDVPYDRFGQKYFYLAGKNL